MLTFIDFHCVNHSFVALISEFPLILLKFIKQLYYMSRYLSTFPQEILIEKTSLKFEQGFKDIQVKSERVSYHHSKHSSKSALSQKSMGSVGWHLYIDHQMLPQLIARPH